MNTLDGEITKFLHNKKNPTSERAHLIQYICDTLFDDKHFKKLLGQTRQCTVAEIRAIFDESRSWSVNPQALFWKLLREKQVKIKKQIAGGAGDTKH